jgi:hypothetical protein
VTMTTSGPARELMPRLRLIHVPATRSPPPAAVMISREEFSPQSL